MSDDTRVNCWEFRDCRRAASSEVATACPAHTALHLDGVNEGERGGRICWAVAGTFCGGVVQVTFAEKQTSCMACDFFKTVRAEQAGNFSILAPGQDYRLRRTVAAE